MTARKATKKKAEPYTSTKLPLDARERHDGQVRVMMSVGGIPVASHIDRDAAGIGAIKLIIAICGLSAAEVKKAL